MSSIAACIVSYYSDDHLLTETVRSLGKAAHHADVPTHLTLVDNTDDAVDSPRLQKLLASWQSWLPDTPHLQVTLLATRNNGGYGAGNNAALGTVKDAYVLVLNPDAVLEEAALSQALQQLASHPACSMLAPRALDAQGHDLMLGHAYPSVLALAGRAVPALRRWPVVTRAMARYELRALDPAQTHEQIVCASGCFMLIPAAHWREANGFDTGYFLYFEDYDLSIRLRRRGPVLYAPQVRLRHMGGDASGKGWRHTWLFISSAARFFRQHGLRWS